MLIIFLVSLFQIRASSISTLSAGWPDTS
ncbi:unnamed protein product [Acanthoscelides obtectus]|uniref:Uncharacterized protein n=1 Tax=Acanthoscelides obtectus TaxID=200917 RepID=A0A9P0JPA9_ACAOB|nr:unnamed protein product [Acanthoscelides obtectus]CAK1665727.1 hypothetical protein AOBTE_LOCUS24937 [Acanthoscelides obtectus]